MEVLLLEGYGETIGHRRGGIVVGITRLFGGESNGSGSRDSKFRACDSGGSCG